jgi:phosphatidate phosphatase PAH1
MSNAQQAEKELDDDLNDELEIEIVDDVEEDNKPRVSEKDYTGPEIPEDDEIESYSERVQKRMKKLSFEAKEAERQRQALAREREELLRVSQTFYSENEKLRQQLQQNEGTLVAQAKARLEAQLAQAKASLQGSL